MVVREINIEYIAVFNPKSDAPVAADRHRPESLQFTLQAVETVAGEIQVGRFSRGIQHRQNVFESLSQGCIHTARIAIP